MAKMYFGIGMVKRACKRRLEQIQEFREEELEDAINNKINLHKIINEDRDKSPFRRFLGRYECTREEALNHLKQNEDFLPSPYYAIMNLSYGNQEKKIKKILNMIEHGCMTDLIELSEEDCADIFGVIND